MAAVTICDLCQAIIKGGPYNDYTENKSLEWSISIGLNGEVDRCEECSRKLFAKITFDSWSKLKKKRKVKPKLKVAARAEEGD